MKPLLFLAVFFAAPALAAEQSAPPGSDPSTLLDAYRLALTRSERVKISEREIDFARARFYRAFNYFLPKVHFEMTRFDQDASESGATFGNSSRRSTPENKFTFSQPLFSGFREIAALRGTGADRRELEARWRRSKELLFSDLVDAYFNVLSARADAEILEAQAAFLNERTRELGERVELGRSRETEMKAAVADAKLVEADLVEARSAAAIAENLLEFYVGRPVKGTALAENAGNDPGPLEKLLPLAALRSDVRADKEAYHVSIQGVVAAQADLFPTASLEGSYYTRRVGFQSGNDWDVTLKLDVPVFEFGTTLGDIKEAHAQREQDRLASEETLRLAELDIRDSYQSWSAAHAVARALEEAARAASENADLQAADYRNNLVNNLEVLDALRRSEDVKRRASDARYEAQKSYWRLKVAVGEVPLNETK